MGLPEREALAWYSRHAGRTQAAWDAYQNARGTPQEDDCLREYEASVDKAIRNM